MQWKEQNQAIAVEYLYLKESVRENLETILRKYLLEIKTE